MLLLESASRPGGTGFDWIILFAYLYPTGYIVGMHIINQTDEFHHWLDGLKDRIGKGAILVRINRARLGNFGDHKDVGDGVSEMRIDVGPGYRVYYGRQGSVVYLLICGGDKSSQDKDIKHAKAIWDQFKKGQQP